MYIPHSVLRDANTETGGGGGFNPFDTASSAPSPTPAVSAPSALDSTNMPAAAPVTPVEPAVAQPGSAQTAVTPVAQPAAGQPSAVATPNPNVVLSPEQFQQLLQQRAPSNEPGQQGQPAMSVEEFQKQFNIFNATDATYEAILGVKPTSPAQVASLNEALQAVSRQSVTIMRHLMSVEANKIRGEFRPAAETVQTQREQAVFNDFVKDYPGLKDYGPMLKEIVVAAKARGENFRSVAEASTFVAAQAARLLNRNVDSFRVPVAQGTSPSPGQPAGNPSARQMSTTSLGGRTGSAGGAAPAKSTAERLFQEANA